MDKAAQRVLMIAVAVVAFYGVKTLKQQAMSHEPSAAELAQTMDAMKREAERQHPSMAKTDALKEVAFKQSAQKLADQTDANQRANTAADMFFGFFFMNTKGRVAYCEQRGVDLTPTTMNSSALGPFTLRLVSIQKRCFPSFKLSFRR